MANSFHKSFQINGISFESVEEILAHVSQISAEMHEFLTDWFSNENTILVKTSGSTGIPKTIALQKEFMINSAIATATYFNLPQKTTALLCLPITYIAGKMMLIRAITFGWYLDIVEASSNPLEKISKSFDFSAMIPLQLENSLQHLHQIKKLIVGGGAVSQQLQEKIQTIDCKVFATYGMTETITHIAIKKLNHTQISPTFFEVLPNVSIYKDHRDCLVIDAKYISEKVIFTNDIVQLVSKNKFEILGRFDNIINSGGIKLQPEIIEEKLSKIIKLRFFVAGIPDEKLGEKLVLLIESKGKIDKEDVYKSTLFSQIKTLKNISKFEIPKEIVILNNFNETTSGKIQRKSTLESHHF
jgi:o-succinylbenzoate---CoA ligase